MITDFMQYDFLLPALLGIFFLSLMTGFISPLLCANHFAFIGSAISHSTILGLAVGLLIFNVDQTLLIYVVTFLITAAGVLTLAFANQRAKLPADSIIGIFYTSSMALGLILFSFNPRAQGQMNSFLFGNILLLTNSDLWILAVTTILVFIIVYSFRKKWWLMSLNSEAAEIQGINILLMQCLFFLIITLVTVVSLKLTGSILINTLLILPGTFALRFSRRLHTLFIISILFSLITSILGLILANSYDLPPGSCLATVQFFSLILAFVLEKVTRLAV
jgi:ABC-type Mn2+/Zn2+ transport system permease subunit